MKKISLKNFENVLTRTEMKNILAGTLRNPVPECADECETSATCGTSSCPNCTGGKCLPW